MYKIALIGAGQLGSRHLQGLAKSSIEIEIEVVEPYESSQKIAKSRLEEVGKNSDVNSVKFYKTIDKLSEFLDVVIVATTSDVRAKVMNELLIKKDVKHLILEKVLFQKEKEYFEIKELLKKSSTICWVNHTRRLFPFYQKLKKELKKAEEIILSVQGGNWGLGCNGLHFIDLLSFLTNTTKIIIDNKYLHPFIYESKRKNFIEFNGWLRGNLEKHLFSLYSYKENIPLTITITSDKLCAFIDEFNNYARIAKKSNNWQWEDINGKIVFFQSELTNKIIENIVINGRCDLPSYDEAMQLHIPFIRSLLNHMEKVDGKVYTVCQIT